MRLARVGGAALADLIFSRPISVLVCGDRHWDDIEGLEEVLEMLDRRFGVARIIHGNARGADQIGGNWGMRRETVLVQVFPAAWDKYGKAAGPMRNRKMIMEGEPDLVVAFHDSIVDSKGTKNMLQEAVDWGVPYLLYSH